MRKSSIIYIDTVENREIGNHLGRLEIMIYKKEKTKTTIYTLLVTKTFLSLTIYSCMLRFKFLARMSDRDGQNEKNSFYRESRRIRVPIAKISISLMLHHCKYIHTRTESINSLYYGWVDLTSPSHLSMLKLDTPSQRFLKTTLSVQREFSS